MLEVVPFGMVWLMCILGDFNVVLFAEEPKRDNPRNQVSTNEFGSWVNFNNLTILPFSDFLYLD